MKKVSSPQNFIVKHAKVHRYQIERDNTEVKALFSYLSRIYRAGCTVENISDNNNLPPDTDNVGSKQELSSDPYQVDGAEQSSDSSTAAESSDRPKSFSGFEVQRKTFFPSCPTSSTPILSSNSYLESPPNLVENLVNSSIDTHESVLCTMDNHERSSEKLMSDQFISSLCESGHLPLQFLLGSLPGVHIKYQELPHISPFTTAMLYLESIGMGFESIQFGFDVNDMGANDSIVSTDASSSGIRGQIETKESRLLQLDGISTVEADHQYIYSDDLSVSVDHEANELEGKYSDCSPHKDSSDENRNPSVQACAPDTAGIEIRTRPHIPEVITECDIYSGLNMSPQKQLDRGFTYCDLAVEAISAFLKVELPSTQAIDAAIDYLESQAIKLHAPSMCTPTINIIASRAQEPDVDTADALKNMVIGYNSNCSLQDGSPSPSKWAPTSHTEQPSVSSTFALSPFSSSLVLAGAEGGLPECFMELTSTHTTLSSPTMPASDPERGESIMDVITNDLEVFVEVHSAPYIEMDLCSRVPSFPIRSFNFSTSESTDLEGEFTVQSESDTVPLDLLSSVENAVRYLERVALSTEDKEASLAVSALKSFSNTLLLSSRVLDLKNYPLWGPNLAPTDPSHSLTTVSASPLEQHMRSFAEDLARKLSGNGCMGDISVPTVSDWMSAYPMNVVADDRIGPPVHEFLHTSDFKNMTDTSGAVALLALMADCVCSSEFDSYFEEKSTSILRRRDRESTPIEAKRRKIVVEDHSSEQFTSKRQQRCPRCGEYKKGHTCRFPGYTEPPSPRIGF